MKKRKQQNRSRFLPFADSTGNIPVVCYYLLNYHV